LLMIRILIEYRIYQNSVSLKKGNIYKL